MSLYNGPPRGGTRGGADQFSWDNVKADKDREYYLGHSVKATTGRWQKGKDVFWYTREKQDTASPLGAEVLAVKQREEELMAEALGYKPQREKALPQRPLDKRDQDIIRGQGPNEEEAAAPTEAEQADRVKGLGYRVNLVRGAADAEQEVLAGTQGLGPGAGPPGAGGLERAGEALPPPPQLTAKEQKLLLKLQAKAARRTEKKAQKEADKAEKRARKESRKERKRQRSRSPEHRDHQGKRQKERG